jgi:hypothetical protein
LKSLNNRKVTAIGFDVFLVLASLAAIGLMCWSRYLELASLTITRFSREPITDTLYAMQMWRAARQAWVVGSLLAVAATLGWSIKVLRYMRDPERTDGLR